mmetsp:Transcript_20373/g.42703  ORF Transcript_20373/g.42703 Transcript_20373/m.42703 type:complete len:224 (-) Transcript_20373:4680-5351(-)
MWLKTTRTLLVLVRVRKQFKTSSMTSSSSSSSLSPWLLIQPAFTTCLYNLVMKFPPSLPNLVLGLIKNIVLIPVVFLRSWIYPASAVTRLPRPTPGTPTTLTSRRVSTALSTSYISVSRPRKSSGGAGKFVILPLSPPPLRSPQLFLRSCTLLLSVPPPSPRWHHFSTFFAPLNIWTLWSPNSGNKRNFSISVSALGTLGDAFTACFPISNASLTVLPTASAR